MAKKYEIEIKSLLGGRDKAESLKKRLVEKFPKIKKLPFHKQLNHYFVDGNFSELGREISKHISPARIGELEKILKTGKNFSVRTREADGKVLIVIKASIDSGSSHNTVSRMEFEEPVLKLNLETLDKLILECDFRYQAKWSREREEYDAGDFHVCLDKNAGYGYLAEFEKMVDDENEISSAKADLEKIMSELEAVELSQSRLERMFAHYNAHWEEYYGTDKTFTIE